MKIISKDSLKLGKFLFFIGLFLLPSAFSLGAIFLLISLLESFKSTEIDYSGDRLNLIFLIGGLFLIISSFINFLDSESIHNIANNPYLTFWGLLNWIPQIFIFIGFQKYLKTNKDRRDCAIALILGSIPVIFSCISQALLNWHGPMRTLFGLIVWYQRPIDGLTGITGLFSNPNYLASWLNIIWPFCLGFVFFDNKNLYKIIPKILFTISVVILIILTASRSAWICLLIPIPLIYPSPFRKYFFYLISLIFLLVINLAFPIFGVDFQNLLRQIIPQGLWTNFTNTGFETLDISRLDIWKQALDLVLSKPIFGYGSTSFPNLLFNEIGLWKGHAHNLPLELMVSYGLPATLIILIPIFYLLYKTYKKLFFNKIKLNKNTIIDKAWLISLSLLILMHLVDIQYFDGRISITGWILLAGTRNIINEGKINQSL